jgi:hypothetical protein
MTSAGILDLRFAIGFPAAQMRDAAMMAVSSPVSRHGGSTRISRSKAPLQLSSIQLPVSARATRIAWFVVSTPVQSQNSLFQSERRNLGLSNRKSQI